MARSLRQRQADRDAVRVCVEWAVKVKDVPAGTDRVGTAATLDGLPLGVSTRAHDGVPVAEFDAAMTTRIGGVSPVGGRASA